MKNNILFCLIGLVILVFAVFSLSSCKDLFHSPLPDPELGVGVLRIEDATSSGAQNYQRIHKVSLYKWGSTELVKQDTEGTSHNGSLEFELTVGDYRVLIDDYNRTNVASDKITITKGGVKVVQYDAYTGVYTYPSSSSNSSYQIGDTGPGGGIIFFAEGGQYKECTGELGSYTWDNAITTAQNHRGGGFTDWHLPDRGELSLMYQNLHERGLGGFSYSYNNSEYWSSAEHNFGSNAWFLDFYNGDEDTNAKGWSYRVRAVRAF